MDSTFLKFVDTDDYQRFKQLVITNSVGQAKFSASKQFDKWYITLDVVGQQVVGMHVRQVNKK